MRRLIFFVAAGAVALALPSANFASRAPAAPKVQLLAHANPAGGYSGDVYVHGGYAYLSSWHGSRCPALGVRVYDVRTPSRPKHVSTFAGAASDPSLAGAWTEKTIVKHVATPAFTGELAVTSIQYCFRGAFAGFGLYDVTDPAHPRRLALVKLEPRGSHEIWMNAVGGRAYVYTAIPYSELESSPDYNPVAPPDTKQATIPGSADFRIFDVSNPQSPRQVGEWGAWKQLHVHPNAGIGGFKKNFCHSVITNAAGTRAFLSYWDLGTIILDVRDPAHPKYLGRTHFRPGEQGDAHSAALGANGKLLIETHETTGVPGGRPLLYDISNPRRPVRLSVLNPPRKLLDPDPSAGFFNSVHDPKIRGKRAYFSWYGLGVVVADISNPRRPRYLTRFHPGGSPDPEQSFCPGGRCSSMWGVYPSGNVVFASDMVGGLWVFRLRPS